MVKKSLEKQPIAERHTTPEIGNRLRWRKTQAMGNIPAAFLFDSGKSLGNPAVEMATPNGTKQSSRGNE